MCALRPAGRRRMLDSFVQPIQGGVNTGSGGIYTVQSMSDKSNTPAKSQRWTSAGRIAGVV